MAFTRAGVAGGVQVEEKDDESSFNMLTLRGLRDILGHLAVGYIGLPF